MRSAGEKIEFKVCLSLDEKFSERRNERRYCISCSVCTYADGEQRFSTLVSPQPRQKQMVKLSFTNTRHVGFSDENF